MYARVVVFVVYVCVCACVDRTLFILFAYFQHVLEGRASKYTALVGVENYYLEYEVKVAAFNYLGQGPNSTVTIIMSAEDSKYNVYYFHSGATTKHEYVFDT